MQSVLEPPVSADEEETNLKGISLKLSLAAHKNLKNLRHEIMPGHRFTIPDIINGILENISADQVQGLMKNTIEERVGLAERKARLDKLIAETPLDELEKLLASRKT